MSDAVHAGRIPETAYKACLGIFLALSVLAVATRTVIRIKTRHELYADDAFLIFGLMCMCVATGLAYTVVAIVYLQEAIVLDPEHYTLPLQEIPTLLKDLEIIDVFIVLAWTAEFSVKISLLFFFRLLVKRLQRLTMYVHIVMGITTVVWAVLICEPFITCPHFGLSGLTKCTPTNVPLTVGLTILIVVLDICTDVMILSIPIIILWKASMSVKQKLGLGAFLTVNFWLIVIALVRVTLFKRGEAFDLTWDLFFQFFEPNVAILAACFSAFRSLFVTHASRRHAQNKRPAYSIRQRMFKRTPPDRQELDELPSIPGATLNGIRTMIWQNNRTQVTRLGSNDTNLNTAVEQDRGDAASEQGLSDSRNKIVVQRQWSMESERATSPHERATDRQLV